MKTKRVDTRTQVWLREFDVAGWPHEDYCEGVSLRMSRGRRFDIVQKDRAGVKFADIALTKQEGDTPLNGLFGVN